MKPRTHLALIVSRLFPDAAPGEPSARAITSELVARVGEWTVTLKRWGTALHTYEAARLEVGYQSEAYTTHYALLLDSRGRLNHGWRLPVAVVEAAQALQRTGLCPMAYAGDDLLGLIEACNRRGVVVVDRTEGMLAAYSERCAA